MWKKMSGVKGENSIKLFGSDLKILEAKAEEIEGVMRGIRGVKDLGILRLTGQPNLLIQVDREASARYGLRVSDVNAIVQAAVGGQAVTQVYEGERLFDLVVRFLPEYRQDVESIGNILVSTPEGARIPLKQVAAITMQTGAFSDSLFQAGIYDVSLFNDCIGTSTCFFRVSNDSTECASGHCVIEENCNAFCMVGYPYPDRVGIRYPYYYRTYFGYY